VEFRHSKLRAPLSPSSSSHGSSDIQSFGLPLTRDYAGVNQPMLDWKCPCRRVAPQNALLGPRPTPMASSDPALPYPYPQTHRVTASTRDSTGPPAETADVNNDYPVQLLPDAKFGTPLYPILTPQPQCSGVNQSASDSQYPPPQSSTRNSRCRSRRWYPQPGPCSPSLTCRFPSLSFLQAGTRKKIQGRWNGLSGALGWC
jgi:hypothetical protein